MKVLVELTFQDYMDMYPSKDLRLIEESEVANNIPAFIKHMNENWSGGRYSESYTILNEDEIRRLAANNEFSDEGLKEISKELDIEF